MLRADFGKNCIIMQFLGTENEGKSPLPNPDPEVSGSGAEFAEKRVEERRETRKRRDRNGRGRRHPGPPEGGLDEVEKSEPLS
jgi:hypothetical protein